MFDNQNAKWLENKKSKSFFLFEFIVLKNVQVGENNSTIDNDFFRMVKTKMRSFTKARLFSSLKGQIFDYSCTLFTDVILT